MGNRMQAGREGQEKISYSYFHRLFWPFRDEKGMARNSSLVTSTPTLHLSLTLSHNVSGAFLGPQLCISANHIFMCSLDHKR